MISVISFSIFSTSHHLQLSRAIKLSFKMSTDTVNKAEPIVTENGKAASNGTSSITGSEDDKLKAVRQCSFFFTKSNRLCLIID